MSTHAVGLFHRAIGLGTAALTLALTFASSAQVTIRKEVVVPSGLVQPLGVYAIPGQPNDIAIVQKGGTIRIVDTSTNTLLPTPFITVPSVATLNEQGLYSIAFHPQYETNGVFYVYYIRDIGMPTAENVIARGTRSASDPLVADTALTDVMVLTGTNSFHNGGFFAFGPDGNLYIGIGDNTVLNNPYSLDMIRGKMLRLDVDGPDNIPGNADDDGFPADPLKNYVIPSDNPNVNAPGVDEMWVTGVRNPFRGSFDRATGDIYLGDVGAESREEVTVIPADTRAWNLGWPCREGTRQLLACDPAPPYLPPFFDFGFEGGSLPVGSQDYAGFRYVIGGYVYRGASMPCLRGTYFFADGASGIYSVRRAANGTVTDFVDRRPETLTFRPTAFGESLAGELFMVFIGDPAFYRIVFDSMSGPDCDGDSIPDACAIRLGWTTDTNSNGIPDRCEGMCTDIDFDNDGLFPDTADIDAFLSVFAGQPCPTEHCDTIDFNNDALFPDTADIDAFLSVFAGGPCA